jgi:WD40 repeat protein
VSDKGGRPGGWRLRASDGGTLWSSDIGSGLSCLRQSHDGECLAGLAGTSLSLFPQDSRHGEVRLDFAGPNLTALAFSPDGQTLAVAAADGTVRLWPWRRLLAAQ